jgi:signal peptide peptidase SppA
MYPLIQARVMNDPWAVVPEVHDAVVRAAFGDRNVSQPAFNASAPFTPVAIAAGLMPPSESGSRLWTRGKLGVIPVQGIIGSHLSNIEMMCGGYSVEQLSNDLDRAGSSGLKNIVLKFHSPGGTVTGVPEVAKLFAKLGQEKTTYAFTDGQSASAAYWIMSQAKHIYMTESAQVGSIGVFVAVVDHSKALASRGVSVNVVADGKYKAMGYPGTSLTEDQLKLLEEGVMTISRQFKTTVTSARRGVTPESMQGQMFRGPEALKANLADSLVTSFKSLIPSLSD